MREILGTRFLVVVVLLAISCDTDSVEPAFSVGRYAIVVPPTAIKSSPTKITIEIDEEDGVVSCELSPHGPTFKKPVTWSWSSPTSSAPSAGADEVRILADPESRLRVLLAQDSDRCRNGQHVLSIGALSVAFSDLLLHRRSLPKASFNAAQTTIAMAASFAVIRALAGPEQMMRKTLPQHT